MCFDDKCASDEPTDTVGWYGKAECLPFANGERYNGRVILKKKLIIIAAVLTAFVVGILGYLETDSGYVTSFMESSSGGGFDGSGGIETTGSVSGGGRSEEVTPNPVGGSDAKEAEGGRDSGG